MIKRFIDIIKFAIMELANRKYKYGLSRTIFLDDITGCVVKAYLDRVLEQKNFYGMLVRGADKMWELGLKDALEKEGLKYQKEFKLIVATEDGEQYYMVVPVDFYSETNKVVLDIRVTTRWDSTVMSRTAYAQWMLESPPAGVSETEGGRRFLEKFLPGCSLPPFLDYSVIDYPIYPSWMMSEIIIASASKCQTNLVAIYKNTIREFVFQPYEVEDDFEGIIRLWLPVVIYALKCAEKKFSYDVLWWLYITEQLSWHCITSHYMCYTCPYRMWEEGGYCPGLFPLQVPRTKEEVRRYVVKGHTFEQKTVEWVIINNIAKFLEETGMNALKSADGHRHLRGAISLLKSKPLSRLSWEEWRRFFNMFRMRLMQIPFEVKFPAVAEVQPT